MDASHWGGPGEDYRLSKISSASINASNGITAPAPDDAAPVWQPPKAPRSFPVLEVVVTVLGVLGMIGLIVLMLNPASSGLLSLAKTTLLSVLSLLIVGGFLLFIDRWEPEPWKTKGALLLWGAGVATLSSGIINTVLESNVALTIGDASRAGAVGATFIAPLVEETFKGLGVLIVVIARRNRISSVLDGIVYAGFSAAGFMFAEDVLYYLRGDNQGTAQLVMLVLIRGFASPFVHAMATSMTGIGLALALLKFKNGWAKAGIVFVFWCCAVLIHFAWNGASVFLGNLFILFYFVVEVPAFIVWAALLLRAASKERDKIRRGLIPYVRTGWVLPGEVTMVTDRRSRRAAITWSAKGGPQSKRAMRSFLRCLPCLGLDQHLMAKHGPDAARIEHDRRILTEAVASRREFLRLTSIAEQQQDVTKAVSSLAQTA